MAALKNKGEKCRQVSFRISEDHRRRLHAIIAMVQDKNIRSKTEAIKYAIDSTYERLINSGGLP